MKDVFAEPEGEDVVKLRKRVDDLEAQIAGLNPRNLAGLNAKEIRAAVRANLFGDGSDGDAVLDGSTDFNDFSSRASTVYTLTRDVFADDLTINTGVTVVTAGFRIFVKKDLLNRGTIQSNGGAGNPGVTNHDGGAEKGGAGGGEWGPWWVYSNMGK